MKKFSYALEFYKNNIFSLDNVKLFKFKVKEAEEIEKYFNQVIYNADFIRKYILRSYYFNKSARFNRRIAYIKGLILGENYLSWDDVIEFSDYIDNNLCVEPKLSLWKYKGYLEDLKNEDFFEGTTKENDNDELFVVVSSESIDYEDNYENDDIEDENNENKDKDEDIDNENIEDIDMKLGSEFIPVQPKEKLMQFKKLRKKYVNETIENKKINSDEISMVKKGMNDWIDYILSAMEDVYRIKEYTLRYNDENISKYL